MTIGGMHIVTYLTNNDRAAFAQAWPDDGAKMAAMMRAQRPHWRYSTVRCIDGEFPDSLDGIDGVIITGSPASCRDDRLPWMQPLMAAIRQLDQARVPTVGICFGHQAIARALGGDVGTAADWGLGRGHCHWGEPMPWMQPWQADMTLMAAHQEQVLRPPPQAHILGGSAHCPIGSMLIGQHLWTTQFHPEMSPAFMDQLLTFLSDHLDPEVIERARAQASAPNDAGLFAQWMAQFFEWERTPT